MWLYNWFLQLEKVYWNITGNVSKSSFDILQIFYTRKKLIFVPQVLQKQEVFINQRKTDNLKFFSVRCEVLVYYRFLDLKEEFWYIINFSDSKMGIGTQQVYTTRKGVLIFHRSFATRREVWVYYKFLSLKKDFELISILRNPRRVLIFCRS